MKNKIDKETNNWKEEWQNMPEFKAEKIQSYKKIVVHFNDQEGVEAFEELIGQKLGKQPSIAYPSRIVRTYSDKRYYDEGEVK